MTSFATDALSELVRRTALRDRVAFRQLYAATSAKLYGTVLRILRRRDLADEVMQEVYLRIWERAGDFEAARASPITWMVTIARNRALDEIRQARPVSLEETPEALDVADRRPLASEEIERNEAMARLDRCFEGLQQERRDMVRLAYLDGCSREELATRFGKPVATVKTWLRRGLMQLKECLES